MKAGESKQGILTKTDYLGWVKIGRRWWVIFQCRLTEYIKLNSSETLNTVFDFLKEVYVSDEDESDIKKHLPEIYAVIKFTVDEIDDTLSWCQIYENEKYAFDKAVNEITASKHLRGLNLKNKVSDIYNTNLIDTHLLEFEWERFCMNIIKNNILCIIYLP